MKYKDWKIPFDAPEQPESLLSAGYPPLLAAVLALRGIRDAHEADVRIRGVDMLYDPMLMQDMPKAVSRIRRAVRAGETIAVFGDYDVDGITSTCLLTDYFRSRGLSCIPYIPDRGEEGYGLNCDALRTLKTQGAGLVITVDCGITAVEEARFARSLGLDLIITDHHECIPGNLPEACAVIDPKREDDSYPNKYLAGVGVALKLLCAFEGRDEAMLERFGDLAAIGTIADVMPLVGENRYIVRRGLELLSRTRRPGLIAILSASHLDPERLSSGSIGFNLAPRLNAAGRVGRASAAAELLLSKDRAAADVLANELCALNTKRQEIEQEIWTEARQMLRGTQPDSPIVLCSPDWNQGVIGIAASRLTEQYSLPAVMICLNPDGTGKGSCRSYGGFNLFDALSACSEHLISFGGHALAAGLNIRADKIEDFRNALAEYYAENRPTPAPDILCDLTITDPALLSLENVRSLERLEPFGCKNPKPLLCLYGVKLLAVSAVGKEDRHTRLSVELAGERFDGIFFSHSPAQLGLTVGEQVDLAFHPQINEFRGHTSVQLLVNAVRRHSGRELCEELLHNNKKALRCALAFRPQRSDHVRVWRSLSGALPDDADALLALCPPQMNMETFCLCLMTFRDAGLLVSEESSLLSALPITRSGKADLETTETMLLLGSRE